MTFFVAFSLNLCSKFVETRLWLEQMTASYYLVALNQHRSPFFHALARFRSFLAQHPSSPCLPLPPPARFLPCHANATRFSRTQRRHIPRAAQTWSLALASYRPPPTSRSSRTLLPQVPCTPCTAPYQWVPPISCIDSTAPSSPRHVHARPVLPCQGLLLPLTAK